jgi:dTDP-4-amino-4,6-dideoxygalactose transaminase
VVPHIYVVKIQGLKNRKYLQRQLLEIGIESGIHYQPNHLLSFFCDTLALPLPVTEKIYPEILSLPLHSDLSEFEVDFVCEKLQQLM